MIRRSNVILTVLIISLFLGALFSPTIPVRAHGVGESLEKVVGEYLVDIGYDAFELRAKESVRFDFSLWTSDQSEEIPFTDIWLRISQNNKAVLAGGIQNPRFGKAGVTYAFPEKGEYTLFVRFQNGDESLVETSFPLAVEEGNESASNTSPVSKELLIGVGVGLVIGSLITFLLRRVRHG
ncbi:MAG: hypothetical protein KJI72_01515 [Patescibacteria group bacterium]|nr:hypothetical protein [Patescibacteria group bacterium]